MNKLHVEIVNDLKQMLDGNNVLAKTFRMVRDRFQEDRSSNVRLRLIGKKSTDERRYNLPTVSEVAALVVGDFKLSRWLQYPLLFPYGEDGYREDIPLEGDDESTGGRKCVIIREYFAYKIQERNNEVPTIVSSRRLFQQFLVDAYTMIESSRLRYIRLNQKKLRCHMYKSLQDAVLHGEINPSSQEKRIILPSSFTGGARYMIQNYQDAMAICKWAGYPDLFITFTFNPKWPEIRRFVESRDLNPEDRPDILARVFKIKLDRLIKDLRDNQIFRKVKADIDQIISVEIPDELANPVYYKAVHNFMMHGPCGSARKSSLCMQSGRCTKHFPERFVESTTIDEEGYPVYRRRDNGRNIKKDGIDLDSRYVVPHNRFLLLKYDAHINVEWCNQSRSIKYLFKYISKGNDRVTAAFSQSMQEEDSSNIDEINMYYDCLYISPCEAAWRIFKFSIHHREPPVERLSFHLPNEQNVIFSDDDPIHDVSNRPSVQESMFLSWFETNKTLPEARELTYAEFPLKFVWKKQLKRWEKRRTSVFSIGRIFFVPPGCLMLLKVQNPMTILKESTIIAISLLEMHVMHLGYWMMIKSMDAIKEASNWGMPSYL
uniref:Helitron helicase-like domain-containing protein n=1 Tax=Nicotiana tabacum TaxID=4097 RepID=A0A1S3ZD48_TOBAC